MKTSQIKKLLTHEPTKREPIISSRLLNSGSTLLNKACTGKMLGAFPMGKYILLVGDSESGKTFLTLTCFAEACRSERFKDYRLIFDDSEDGAMMDKAMFFGSKVEDRVEPPAGTKDDPVASQTVEQFYDFVDDALNDGRPFIYVKDSENSLTSEAAIKKIGKQRKARQSDREEAGSYGDGKAIIHSSRLRIARNRLKETGSILIIISQTRDRIGFGAQFDPKTRSGGNALKFYADLEIWTKVKANITKTIKGKKRQQGIVAEVKVKKNRINGKKRTVLIPLYHTFGIDDVGSMIDYLVEEKHWKASGREGGFGDLDKKITAPEFRFQGSREQLVKQIEHKNQEKQLRLLVSKVWDDIEAASKVERKRRYT